MRAMASRMPWLSTAHQRCHGFFALAIPVTCCQKINEVYGCFLPVRFARDWPAKRSFSTQPIAGVYNVVILIWLGEKSTARKATSIINRFPRRIKHRNVRAIRSNTFSNIPPARGPDKVDIGEDNVD